MNNKKVKVEKFLTKQLTTTNNTSNILPKKTILIF